MLDHNPKMPPAPSNRAPEEDEVVERRTLRDYYIILRERLWIALPLALIISVSYGFVRSREEPMYFAGATLQFEKQAKIVSTEGVVDPSIHSEMDMGTDIEILNSGRLRDKVVESLSPDEIKILQRPYVKTLKAGQALPGPSELLGSLSINPRRGSFIISIVDHNRDPDGAAIIANHYVDQFMDWVLKNVGGKSEFAVDYLTKRSKDLQEESEKAEHRLQDYKLQNNMLSLDSSVNIVNEKYKSLASRVSEAHIERLNLEGTLEQIRSYKAAGKDLLQVSAIASHGSIGLIKAQIDTLKRDQAVIGERYGERHPKMIDLANSINALQQQLDKAVDSAIADVENQLAKKKDDEAKFGNEFVTAEKEAINLGKLGVEFKSLEDQAVVQKNNYIQILDRLNQLKTSKNLEDIPIRPLDKAKANYSPESPNIQGITRTAVGLGVVIFVGVAVGLSFLDDRIKSAWDVETFIGTHLLGIVPDLGSVTQDERGLLAFSNQSAPGAEAFLGIYSSIKIQSKLDFPKSILVTSTIPGEGKTLVSSNLAASFARHGKDVLLIDFDMRRPMLHRHFKLQNDAGIIAWADAGMNFSENLMTDSHLGITKIADHLWLLRSGGRSKSPTELLENPVCGQLIETLKRRFDLLVIDSPPLGAVTDALLIAERTDEVVYVCRFNRAYRKHIRLYIKSLRQGKNEILGIILNGLSHRRIEYYSNYRYYRSYKKYYGSQT